MGIKRLEDFNQDVETAKEVLSSMPINNAKNLALYLNKVKELKLKRVFLHEEYTRLVYNVTGVISPIESVKSKFLETKAVFNLKATLTSFAVALRHIIFLNSLK